MIRFGFIFLLFLTSCDNPADILGKKAPPEWVDPDTLLEKGSLYCYKTLADYDCYAAPQANEMGRLEGFYGPPVP